MDRTTTPFQLTRFILLRVVTQLSVPRIECWSLLNDEQMPMSLDEIHEHILEEGKAMCSADHPTLMSGDIFQDVETASAHVMSCLPRVDVQLQPDPSQFLMEQFARFSPERLSSSWRVMWENARMGLGRSWLARGAPAHKKDLRGC